MREINAAWEVLRNPSARARYDDQLKEQAEEAKKPQRVTSTSVFDNTGANEAAAPPSPVRARPRVISLEPEDVADLAPADGPVDAASGRRWLRWAPAMIGGAVVVVVLIAAAFSSRPASTVKLSTVEEFGVGTCVVILTDPATVSSEPGEQASPAISSTPCTSPHNGRVVSQEPVPRPCPNGTKAFVNPDDDTKSVCVVAEP